MNGLKKRRRAAGMTQAQLAEALLVKRATVAMWETGQSLPRAELLPAIAKLLDCSIDDLFAEAS